VVPGTQGLFEVARRLSATENLALRDIGKLYAQGVLLPQFGTGLADPGPAPGHRRRLSPARRAPVRRPGPVRFSPPSRRCSYATGPGPAGHR
jgi:hypothetical protein